MNITNAHGKEIDFDAAAALMDDGIAAELEHGDGLTEQEFFEEYCLRHRAKFGEEYVANTSNPVW